MGIAAPHPPVLLIVAAFSRYDAALDWAAEQLQQRYGPIALDSPRFDFADTDYYQPSMGPELKKQLLAFADLRDPTELVEIKLVANALELEYAAMAGQPEPRPLNLDPGYLTLAKLVLASTKDHAHRIYVDRGIYAEVTLSFKHGAWQSAEWTFPDYRRPDYHRFLVHCRDFYRQQSRGENRR